MSAMKAGGVEDVLAGEIGIDLAFEHLGQLASLLHAAGHREMAALMQGIWDMRQLARRPGQASVGADEDMLQYVFGQLADLAAFLEEQGRHDAALLFRMPAELHAVRQSMARGDLDRRAQA